MKNQYNRDNKLDITDIVIVRDCSPENIKPSGGFKQSEFVVQTELSNGTYFWLSFPNMEKMIRQIGLCETNKYPTGIMKDTMFLYEHIFPIFEIELTSHGFNPTDGLEKLKEVKRIQNENKKPKNH